MNVLGGLVFVANGAAPYSIIPRIVSSPQPRLLHGIVDVRRIAQQIEREAPKRGAVPLQLQFDVEGRSDAVRRLPIPVVRESDAATPLFRRVGRATVTSASARSDGICTG